MIYFDNAATTLMKPSSVPEAVGRAITSFGGAGRGTHAAALAAGMAIHTAREQVADLLGAQSSGRVAFMPSATYALNAAINGFLQPGDHVITSAASHNSVLRPLYRMCENGCRLSILPVRHDGSIDYDEFASLFTPKTRLAVMTHASNVTGDVYDISRLAAICHNHGALFVVDVAQTAGIIPINMRDQQLDIIAFTGHKSLFGPQGTGGLCVRDDVDITPFAVGGSGVKSFDTHHPAFMPEALEAGTLNAHGIAGLSAGIAYVAEVGVEAICRKIAVLTSRFEEGVSALGPITVYGGHAECGRCGIVALNVGDRDPAEVCDYLSTEWDIATRCGVHCAPLMHHALGTADGGLIRFSFSCFNTEEEVDQGIRALAACV